MTERPEVSSVIVLAPMYMTATVNQQGADATLTVYVSPVVGLSDELYDPVLNVLDWHCYSIGQERVIEDDLMMFGEAREMNFILHRRCPGDGVPHRCYKARQGLKIEKEKMLVA